MSAATATDLELSRVFARTMEILLRRPTAAILLAIPTIALPNFAFTRLWGVPESVFSWEFLATVVCWTPVASMAALFCAWMTLQAERGEDASPLTEVATRFVPLLLTAAAVYVVLLLGTLALVIPGIIWSIASIVAVPAAAVERLGSRAAIERSLELTRFRRWTIFSYSLVLGIGASLVFTIPEFAIVGGRWEQMDQNPFITTWLRPIADTIYIVFFAAFYAALYGELVRLGPVRSGGEAAAS